MSANPIARYIATAYLPTMTEEARAYHRRLKRNAHARYRRYARKHGCSMTEAQQTLTAEQEDRMQSDDPS